MTMVKKRVAELEGAQLDWAVAIANGLHPAPSENNSRVLLWVDRKGNRGWRVDGWHPSTLWMQGGPIIERERIDLIAPCGGSCDGKPFPWRASVEWRENVPEEGRTPLIAAMRAFVASKLGDEVEVPQ